MIHLIFGPIIHAFETFTKVSKLDSEVQLLRSELPQDIQKIKDFYATHAEFLHNQLKEYLTETSNCLTIVNTLTIPDITSQNSLQERLNAYKESLVQLRFGKDYFSNLAI